MPTDDEAVPEKAVPEKAGPEEPVEEPAEKPTEKPTEDQHTPEGLELARLIARSLKGAAAAPSSRGRAPGRRTPSGGRVRGRGRVTDGPTLSGAHPDDRDPQTVANTLGRLVADQGWQTDLRVRGLFARWPELVGADVAAHCTPETFAEGRLVVRTDSTAWATQLRLLAPDVVRRLNEELGHGTVTFLDVEGPLGPSWRKGRLRVRGRGPRDTYG